LESAGGWPITRASRPRGCAWPRSLLMKKAPALAFTSESDREFYDSYAMNRRRALARLQRLHRSLMRRIQRIESVVTGRDFDWDRRMRGE